jgi:hypothetical protein
MPSTIAIGGSVDPARADELGLVNANEASRVGSEIKAPDTLVDAIFHAAADVGSIPTASAAAHASCRSLKRTQPDRQRFVLVGEWRLDVGRVGGDFHAGVTPECLVDQYPQLKPR